MSEEKNNFENEENTAPLEEAEVSENTSEENSEKELSENITPEAPEQEVSENNDENTEYLSSENVSEPESITLDDKFSPSDNKKKNITAALIAGGVIIILVVIAVLYNMDVFETNKYNKMGYINISGRSLSDLADAAGLTLEELKEEYGLPEDMTGDTDEAAAFYNMPTEKIAEMYGMDFTTLKETLQLPDTITETTPWGEAEGEALLKNYVGSDDAIASFKEEYGLGDNITADTKWKEVRNIVDGVMLEKRKKQEREASKATSQPNGSEEGTNELSDEELQALIDQAMNSADGTAATSGDAPSDETNNTQASADNAQAPADNQ